MLRGFGAELMKVQVPFQPEGGAYSDHGHHHNRDDRGDYHEKGMKNASSTIRT
jgi:urease accessory protein